MIKKKHSFLFQRNGVGISAHIWGNSHPPVTPNPKEADSSGLGGHPTHINAYMQMHTEIGESGERGRECTGMRELKRKERQRTEGQRLVGTRVKS